MRTEVDYQEVLTAVHTYVAEDASGIFTTSYAYRALATALNVQQSLGGTRYLDKCKARFRGQVLRAFGALVEEGALRKVERDRQGPDGTWAGAGEVRYYTPAAWDRAEKQVRERQAAEQELEAARQVVYDRFHALGIGNYQWWGNKLQLDLDGWDQLLSLAEHGKSMRGLGETVKGLGIL